MGIRQIATTTCLALVVISKTLAAESAPQVADVAESNDRAALHALLDQDADVNAPQPDGMTALHWAVFLDDVASVQLLLDAGAEPEALNYFGVMPLSLAARNGNSKIVTLLLEAGANPNAKLRGGETVLMTAARTGKPGPLQALLDRGAEVNATERKGQTACMWAAAEGHTKVVKALLAAGADVRTPLKSGYTPFFFAIREGHTEVVSELLTAGIDVNETMQPRKVAGKSPKQGTSPLVLAVENGHFELALALLAAGADPNDRSSGYTALHALTWVRKPIRGDGNPAPIGSGEIGSLELVRQLVQHGADVNLRHKKQNAARDRLNKTEATPFLLASETADLPLMHLLLELGADPSLANVDQCTPLLAAAGIGVLGDGDEAAGTEDETIAAVNLLLQRGADINAVANNGSTAMHGAAYKSYTKLIKFLVDNGANVHVWNRKNKRGWTPLMIAEGNRPGNFRPSQETIVAVQDSLQAAGIEYLPEFTAEVQRDLEYAQIGEHKLLLDLYLPHHASKPPLIVWVHGGAWRGGSKRSVPIRFLLKQGFAIASVDYRLSPVAKFPAQIHDCKAAIRYLRAEQETFGYDARRIGVAGASAGGHLAALLAVTNGHTELEGRVGAYLEASSDVQAVVDYYGPTNFQTILQQSTPHGLGVRIPALQLLLGGQPDEKTDLAILASPVSHVEATDPPILIIHGDQDPQVPINQSHELLGVFEQVGREATLEVVHGGAHGGKAFVDQRRIELVTQFYERHLRAKDGQ
ncbi:ankyrin repeat domain-containing protein [Adhaeretor mobilis]|uniref:Carboxylesterase NlhH n=1 Tax=Adhaeretor mobilis TaxID=1930276 RepID=A0A517N0R0_9BACT|nr:ankyrin repeat domain-containing protein [Adhaeretor mobilis]QDT00716.1 Carboxylesterase NlhH [Adhaeretor mobilis]